MVAHAQCQMFAQRPPRSHQLPPLLVGQSIPLQTQAANPLTFRADHRAQQTNHIFTAGRPTSAQLTQAGQKIQPSKWSLAHKRWQSSA